MKLVKKIVIVIAMLITAFCAEVAVMYAVVLSPLPNEVNYHYHTEKVICVFIALFFALLTVAIGSKLHDVCTQK